MAIQKCDGLNCVHSKMVNFMLYVFYHKAKYELRCASPCKREAQRRGLHAESGS